MTVCGENTRRWWSSSCSNIGLCRYRRRYLKRPFKVCFQFLECLSTPRGSKSGAYLSQRRFECVLRTDASQVIGEHEPDAALQHRSASRHHLHDCCSGWRADMRIDGAIKRRVAYSVPATKGQAIPQTRRRAATPAMELLSRRSTCTRAPCPTKSYRARVTGPITVNRVLPVYSKVTLPTC